MSHRFGVKGNIALMVSHCAGMIDLVAMPLWIGVLVASYQFDSQEAGGLVTFFLAGAVVASMFVAPRFKNLNRRMIATVGFFISGLCFFAAAQTNDYALLALLHVIAGLSASSALSVAHGTIARNINPHRLFALAGFALGIMGFVFMGAAPNIIKAVGGHSLFLIFAGIMAVGAFACALAFPRMDSASVLSVEEESKEAARVTAKIPTSVWYGIVGFSLMSVTQVMTFAFMERVGNERGFSTESITMVLVALALINIVAAASAGIFQKRISPRIVLFVCPVLQVILSNIMMNATGFPLYAASAAFFVSLVIFIHPFFFGLVAQLDTSGRALAATPAMIMSGAAIGPILGGTIVKLVGYHGIGIAALVLGSISLVCFARLFHQSSVTDIESESVA
ncbi:MFS transporter [Marinomonas sp. TW1]|uniref:MFS transporter n=1 Tax=Marinomonas sp. TW1 TaxID=1561203 RepID=UPI0007AF04FC|nr:MFS transporter [Marinomonas sp. TW1]KZN15331.1 MFS transporter [Marinomonas sp. TW1]